MKPIIEMFEEFYKAPFDEKDRKDAIDDLINGFERSIEIDYNRLERISPHLADLLLDEPKVFLEKANLTLNSLHPEIPEPKMNVRIKNFNKCYTLKKLSGNQIGQMVNVEGIIKEVGKVHPTLKTAIFECNSCLHRYSIEQSNLLRILEPSLCECGSRSFKLLADKSDYVDMQKLVISDKDTKKELSLILEDDLCSIDDYIIGDRASFTGILTAIVDKSNNFKEFLRVNNIEPLESLLDIDDEAEEIYL